MPDEPNRPDLELSITIGIQACPNFIPYQLKFLMGQGYPYYVETRDGRCYTGFIRKFEDAAVSESALKGKVTLVDRAHKRLCCLTIEQIKSIHVVRQLAELPPLVAAKPGKTKRLAMLAGSRVLARA